MQFRTEVHIPEQQNKISYKDNLFFIGSCFSVNIGDKFQGLRFDSLVNPFGTIFNPLSIEFLLRSAIENKQFTENDIFYFNERWQSFYFHSDLSKVDKEECLNGINVAIQETRLFIENTDFLFITFGTAWVYENIETNKIVANCHKISGDKFRKRLLTQAEIAVPFQRLVDDLEQLNENIKIIFTVSPVRHWKDGAVGNQRSKSVLNSSVHQLVDDNENCSYFPAYELVMDDLRDYRFYEKDMLHPNSIAVQYIWEQLSNAYIEKDSLELAKEIDALNTAKKHMPFNENSESHNKFLLKIKEKSSLINLKLKKYL